VRHVLIRNNSYLEELPAELDVKKLEKQIKKDGEKLVDQSALHPLIKNP
jgi:hypothetical protein